MFTLAQPKIVVTATSVVLIQLLNSNSAPFGDTFAYRSINLNFQSTALASTPQSARPKLRYVPPNRRSPKTTQATGSRGCTQANSSQPIILNLLVPSEHDGLTISSHPTFFWHVSAPVQLAFALTERGVVQPLLEQQMQVREAGIMQLKMPHDLPELVSGREYRWSVTLICNPSRPSAGAFIHSWIKRVPTTPEIAGQIAVATSERDRAQTYAQAGLWYDALEAISTAHNVNPNDKSIFDERLLLLEQVGLTQVAEQERQRLARTVQKQYNIPKISPGHQTGT